MRSCDLHYSSQESPSGYVSARRFCCSSNSHYVNCSCLIWHRAHVQSHIRSLSPVFLPSHPISVSFSAYFLTQGMCKVPAAISHHSLYPPPLRYCLLTSRVFNLPSLVMRLSLGPLPRLGWIPSSILQGIPALYFIPCTTT